MELPKDPWAALFEGLRNVRAAWPMRGWSWDTRLNCVSSSFGTEREPEARAAAARALHHEWTPATLERAPSVLRELAIRTGGLRSGQLILGSSSVGDAYAYGLWWPWGDGVTTSLRIGLAGSVRQEAHQRLREAFGVEL